MLTPRFKQILFLIGDLILLVASLYLTLLIRNRQIPDSTSWLAHLQLFLPVFAVLIITFYVTKLYNLYSAFNFQRFLTNTLQSLFIVGVFSLALFYLYPHNNLTPKTNLILFWVIFVTLFLIWRGIFNWTLKNHITPLKVVSVGYNAQLEELIKLTERNSHFGYKIIAIAALSGETLNHSSLPIWNDVEKIKDQIKLEQVTHFVLTSDPRQSCEVRNALFECLPLKINFVSLANFYEELTGTVPLNIIDQAWFLENLSDGVRVGYTFIKTIFDFIFSSTILIVTLPIWLIIGFVVKLESRGPIFFTQKRVGLNGKIFTLIKFRTMKVEGNNFTPTTLKDPRVTWFGAILRATRLDELPQVLNIIKGEMAFVGPRPERPEIANDLKQQIPFYFERTLVKPGITGWDQVSGEYHSPSPEDSLKKLQYDLFYIKNRSFYLDLSIILKTIATIISRGGK